MEKRKLTKADGQQKASLSYALKNEEKLTIDQGKSVPQRPGRREHGLKH